MILELVKPLLDVQERVSLRDVVDHQGSNTLPIMTGVKELTLM